MATSNISRFSKIATDPLRSFRFYAQFTPTEQKGYATKDFTTFSGGFTNISGLSYLGRTTRPPQSKSRYGGNSDHEPHVKFTKMIQNEFVRVLQEKIEQEKVGTNDLSENLNIIRKKDLKSSI